MRSASRARSISRLVVPGVAVALLLALSGCAATRERLAGFDVPDASSFQPSRPAWLAWPDRPSWRKLPLVARWLAPEPGEIRGTVRGSGDGAARGPRSPGVLVYLDPIDEDGVGSPEGQDATSVVRLGLHEFDPPLLAVRVGRPVAFRNRGRIYHRIFSYSEPNAFDLGAIGRGQSQTVTFEEPGEVRVYCALHPGESGVVFVTPSPWFAVAERSGAYRIAGVPPGQYQLRTWSDSRPPATRAVTIRSGVASDVDLALP
jgi:plastocyanin